MSGVLVWDVIIGGFTQNRGEINGSDHLWRLLRRYQGPSRECVQYDWHDDMALLADRIKRHSDPKAPPIIRVCAFSWGGGYAFPRLASELAAHGIEVTSAVLCDPVARTWWLPTWLPANLLSLTSALTIRLENVRRVYWFRQDRTRPRGHDVDLATGRGYQLNGPVWLDAPHVGLDSHPAYHEAALKMAGGLGEHRLRGNVWERIY